MRRKRITQLFPWLTPLRAWQRKCCFYIAMRFDGKRYAADISPLRQKHTVFETKSILYNSETGFDMEYQENKVFNLKLAAKKLDGLLIKPGETFSFWRSIRGADKHTAYKDGLVVVDGKLVTKRGGGLCQMSNLLFWLFLHSPLTIAERHTHRIQDFPVPKNGEPEGVDATVSEGWLDLKVRNETALTFQIKLYLDSEYITGSLLSSGEEPCRYEIIGKNLRYYRKGGAVYQKISISRVKIRCSTGEKLSETFLYENICEVGYRLPEGTLITEGEEQV